MVNFSNRFLIDLVCQNMLQTCFHWSCLDNGTMVCQIMSLSCTQICSYNLMLQIPHHHTHHHMSHPLHHNCHTSSHLLSHVQCTLQCLFVFACIYLDPFHTRANFSTKCKYMHQIQLFWNHEIPDSVKTSKSNFKSKFCWHCPQGPCASKKEFRSFKKPKLKFLK